MFFLNERISRGILTNSKAGIAQLVERNLAKVEVASSNLVSRSSFFQIQRLAGAEPLIFNCKGIIIILTINY